MYAIPRDCAATSGHYCRNNVHKDCGYHLTGYGAKKTNLVFSTTFNRRSAIRRAVKSGGQKRLRGAPVIITAPREAR